MFLRTPSSARSNVPLATADVPARAAPQRRDVNGMLRRRTEFPIAEGLGIFVGVVGWDLLSEGQLEIIKALLIAAPATLLWFALRCWRGRNRDRDENS